MPKARSACDRDQHGAVPKIRELDRGLQEQQQLDAILDLITGDLRAALDLPLHSVDPSRGLHFEGKAGEMTFVAVVRTGSETRGLREMHYFTRKAIGRLELLRERKTYAISSETSQPQGATQRLLRDIRGYTSLTGKLMGRSRRTAGPRRGNCRALFE